MKKMLILVALLTPFLFAFTTMDKVETLVTCDDPENVAETAHTVTDISFSWDTCNCDETSYKVYYWKKGEASPGPDNFTTNTSYPFTGLSTGTYNFYFQTICGSETSGFVIIEDIIMG